MLNLTQLAEKIASRNFSKNVVEYEEEVKWLESLLKEAIEEAVADGKQRGKHEAYSLDTDYHRKIGRSEAYRICAEIAEQLGVSNADYNDACRDIEQAIRAKAAEEKA